MAISENGGFSRGPRAVEAAPGKERETFLNEVSTVLGRDPSELDVDLDLQEEYDCDELDVVECIQIAEDIWDVSLMPSPFTASDAEKALEKYKTLAIIVEEASRGKAL